MNAVGTIDVPACQAADGGLQVQQVVIAAEFRIVRADHAMITNNEMSRFARERDAVRKNG